MKRQNPGAVRNDDRYIGKSDLPWASESEAVIEGKGVLVIGWQRVMLPVRAKKPTCEIWNETYSGIRRRAYFHDLPHSEVNINVLQRNEVFI